MTYKQIMSDLHKGAFQPIYFLYGEEPYFIDAISNYIQEHALPESEKAFNQSIVYGRDTKIPDLISLARRFPMMAQHQVIIVKEAQELQKIEELEVYVNNPLPSTILVINYKYKKLDNRTKLAKLLSKKSVFFESKRLYENKVPDWIHARVKERQADIDYKAAMLLTEYLGSDLEKIDNEIHKLIITLPPENKKITPAQIERNIGINKDYNNFELLNALADKNKRKVYQIVDYFSRNQKNHPFIVTLYTLYGFFSKVLAIHSLPNKSPESVARELNMKPFVARNYLKAFEKYRTKKLVRIIHALREYDMRSKGVNNVSTEPGELLKELIFFILN